MKNLSPLILLFVSLFVFVMAIIYLAGKVAEIIGMEPNWILYTSIPVIFFMSMIGIGRYAVSTSFTGAFLYRFSGVFIGFLLYFLMTFIAIDFINIWLKLDIQQSFMIVSSITIILSLIAIVNSYIIRTTNIDLTMPHIQETINLVHLTDIHLGLFRGRKFLERIVKKTNDLNPDLILNTGDLFDGRNQLSPQTLEPLTELEAPHYFIDGNHDEYTGVNEIRELLRNLGVLMLENEVVSRNNVNIIGLKYMRADGKTFDMHASIDSGPTIKNTLESMKIPDNKANIILHHSPVGINYAQEAGGNLFLAGHTHGGQIIPFNFFTKLAFPFNRGLYDFKQMKVFVSEGLGTFGPPMRLGTKSEVVMIRLIPEK